MTPDSYLLVFGIAFAACVITTPIATRLAVILGAVDRPDNYRRIHKAATPRMGGLALAVSIPVGLVAATLSGVLSSWPGSADWITTLGWIGAAAATVLALGIVDDTVGVGPRAKLIGQGLGVLFLYLGGIRIESLEIAGSTITLSYPLTIPLSESFAVTLNPISMLVTLFWFLGCMNIWNLIDGMDGLASGVGLLVSATMLLVAAFLGNFGAALMAAALAGGLAGFLLYNWHPACVFLGDSGSLLIGLLIGIIGIQGSQKEAVTVSILVPILAMGLPISDTALAIFRRWVRNLPMTAADRRHVHHLLIGLGLSPRQAAAMLYSFTAFLCGAVLLGVAARNDTLSLILGASGCVAFVIVLYSRRDELSQLRADLSAIFTRGGAERRASKITWESIQRVELTEAPEATLDVVLETARILGCVGARLTYHGPDRAGVTATFTPSTNEEVLINGESVEQPEAATEARFRLSGVDNSVLDVAFQLASATGIPIDITFRYLQRLVLAARERLLRLSDETGAISIEPHPILPTEIPESSTGLVND